MVKSRCIAKTNNNSDGARTTLCWVEEVFLEKPLQTTTVLSCVTLGRLASASWSPYCKSARFRFKIQQRKGFRFQIQQGKGDHRFRAQLTQFVALSFADPSHSGDLLSNLARSWRVPCGLVGVPTLTASVCVHIYLSI